jgi:translocation and assembly module TamA
VYQFEDGSGDLLRLDARVAAFTTTFTYDARDNIFNPRAGWFHSSRIEAGPGGWLSDIAFSRYQTQQYAYVPLGPVVFASGLRFGSLDVDDERQTASLALRFKAGGSTTVRGYEQDSLSPLTLCVRDGRAQLGGTFIAGAECLPLGGKVLLVINEEVRVPIYRWFGAAAFVDLGNTFEGLDTFAWGDLALGTGLGLRINTPVFVVRLDAGFPVPRETGGPRVRWYFSIGQAF